MTLPSMRGPARHPDRRGLSPLDYGPGMDMSSVAQYMPTLVPMVGTLSIEFLELAPQRVVLRLPDQPAYHNHIGGPHAGAMFTLAESASGALVLGNFGAVLDRATPLAVSGSIRYKRVAMGDLYAEALLHDSPESIVAQLDEGKRPEFEVEVRLATEDWTVTGEATFVWTLRPNRP
jgi:acyl-coenzyme A thioesterase PaaI-like protein